MPTGHMGSLSVWLCFTRRYPMLMLRPGMPGRPGLPGRPGSPGRDREAALHLPRGLQPACLQRARRHSRPQGWGQWLCPWGLRASWGGLTLAQYPLPVQDRVTLLDLRGAAIPRVRNPTPHMSTQGPNSVPDTAERLIRPQQVTLSLSQGVPSPRCPSPAPTVSPARHRLSCSSGVMWTLAGVRV